jgi:hypothetical protein
MKLPKTFQNIWKENKEEDTSKIQDMAHNQEQDGSLLTSPSVVLDTIISEPYAGLCFSILIDGSAFNLLEIV